MHIMWHMPHKDAHKHGTLRRFLPSHLFDNNLQPLVIDDTFMIPGAMRVVPRERLSLRPHVL